MTKKKDLESACPKVRLGAQLGSGGNAHVFLGELVEAVRGDTPGADGDTREFQQGTVVAVKFLVNSRSNRYARFLDEVKVVRTRLNSSHDVVPILFAELPDSMQEGAYPWYAMPPCVPLRDAMKPLSWLERLRALEELAQGLARIHAQGVAHRDIKPENLFELEGTYRFGDFGIAQFPESAGVTKTNEPMGPAHYIAHEMLTNPDGADATKADVYSFGKTVWALLTEHKFPFPGQYSPQGPLGLTSFENAKRMTLEPLDELLHRATSDDPRERPSADQFASELRQVLAAQTDFIIGNRLQWQAAERDALRTEGLVQATWEGVQSIAAVLDLLSRREGMNHLFYPDSGGLNVLGARTVEGGTMLALKVTERAHEVVVRPRRLTCYRFDEGADFNVAVLETDDVPPVGAGPEFSNDWHEYLRRADDTVYAPREYADETPERKTLVATDRYFRGGVFVLAPTAGHFNAFNEAYKDAEQQVKLYLAGAKRRATLRRTDNPRGIPTLLPRIIQPAAQFILRHLTEKKLLELIALDDQSASKWHKSNGELRTPYRMSDTRAASVRYFEELKPDEQAEYMALVDVGRNNMTPREFEAELLTRMRFDSLYLTEKLGNGYLRSALARFGVTHLAGQPLPPAPEPDAEDVQA